MGVLPQKILKKKTSVKWCRYLKDFSNIITFTLHLLFRLIYSRAQKKVYTFKMTVVKLNIAAF